MADIVNIAAYKFAILDGLRARRASLLEFCRSSGLKGTVLLSIEGINLFVAGEAANVDALLAELRSWPGLEDLKAKVSRTDHQPFRRMLVRLKKEIIAFGVEGIEPARRTSPKLAPQELKRWLDEGRPVTLLDTRNDYEIKLGTFKNALPIGVDHFRDFPDAVRRLPEEMKDRPIVMFCTGGIRCEKAGPFMEREGFKHIFQLDGGILKYFEDCGSEHYYGECFVFDDRVGVDPHLRETDSAQCFACQTPLTADDQKDERYVPPKSCPYCFKTPAEQMAANIARREDAICRVSSPLPGGRPYENSRPVNIPAQCDGFTLLDALCSAIKQVPRETWEQRFEQGRVIDDSGKVVSAAQIVRAGERFLHKLPAGAEPDVDMRIQILHEDEALVVLNKPAPLPMHPGGRFNRNTLQYVLEEVYRPQKPRPAHRLDANTTGIVLVARTRHFAARLQSQFAEGTVQKTYLVCVHGLPRQEVFSCDAPISAGPGELGSRTVDMQSGLAARTEFRVLQRRPDGTTLLEARPITGRTNQIRIHLAHLNLPICGDPVYRAGEPAAQTQTLAVGDPPLCLHAWKIAFLHPLTRQPLHLTAVPPKWAEHILRDTVFPDSRDRAVAP